MKKNITALYERLSRDDELRGDSCRIANQKLKLQECEKRYEAKCWARMAENKATLFAEGAVLGVNNTTRVSVAKSIILYPPPQSKQVAMCPCSGKRECQHIIFSIVNQQPTRLNVAFPMSRPVAA